MIRVAFLLAVLISSFGVVVNGQDPGQRSRTLFVTVEGSKTDFVGGLKAENFEIFDNKTALRMTGFSDKPEPMSVGFLFDVSGSVLGWGTKALNDAAESIRQVVGSDKSKSEYFLTGFNRTSKLFADWTSDPDVMYTGLKKLPLLLDGRSTNITSLHDACIGALAKLGQGKNNKKVLVLFSDGADNSLKPNPKEVISSAKASGAIIYFISIADTETSLDTSAPKSYSLQQAQKEEQTAGFINILTNISGGKLYKIISTKPTSTTRIFVQGSKSGVQLAFEKLFRELGSQYTLRYSLPSGSDDALARETDIKLTVPKEIKKDSGSITVRFRRKYGNKN